MNHVVFGRAVSTSMIGYLGRGRIVSDFEPIGWNKISDCLASDRSDKAMMHVGFAKERENDAGGNLRYSPDADKSRKRTRRYD